MGEGEAGDVCAGAGIVCLSVARISGDANVVVDDSGGIFQHRGARDVMADRVETFGRAVSRARKNPIYQPRIASMAELPHQGHIRQCGFGTIRRRLVDTSDFSPADMDACTIDSMAPAGNR